MHTTYTELDTLSNTIAYWAYHHSSGSTVYRPLRAGTTAAVMLPNGLPFVSLWLGLAKVGVTIACLNTGLSDAKALVHAVRVSGATVVICAERYRKVWAAAIKVCGSCE